MKQQLPTGEPPGGRTGAAMWGIGVLVYVVAVVHRSSLGVAGIDAAERFGVGASALSTFSILQVLVYAGMQIPVGLLVDRHGPKRVLSCGIVLFTAGQLGFALSTAYEPALISRAVLGLGDAMTFVSVLRLGGLWFSARRGPLIAQFAALFGMAGNLVSTLLLASLLHSAGWTRTFVGTALGGAFALVLVLVFLKDRPGSPAGPPPRPRSGHPPLRAQIAAAWREPGTRLGMWTHFTTQFPGMVFLLLWGMPYLVEAQGLGRGTAGMLLTLIVLSNMVLGVVFGNVIARHNRARMPITLGVILSNTAVWAAVLAWPSAHAPMWLLVVLALVLGSCGPASMVGFDFARPANPPQRLGTASGIVNMGGFTASMITLLTIGLLLDRVDGGSAGAAHSPDAYRVAFCSLFVIQAVGLSQILRLRGRAARLERERITASRVETVHVPAAAN
ncbi:MFS transporter [Streptomyces capparidis]